MKIVLKNIILSIIRLTGLLYIIRYLTRYDIIILMVHGVMDNESEHSWKPLRNYLSVKNLSKSLSVLNKSHNFVSLDDAVDIISGKIPAKPYCIVLTFDDGYKNNLIYATPTLSQYKIPATIYLSTSHVEQQKPFWFDRLDYAVQQQKDLIIKLPIGSDYFDIDSSNRKIFSKTFKLYLKNIKERARTDTEMLEEIEAITDKLEHTSKSSLLDFFKNDKWTSVISWDDTKTVPKKLITFGSHTADHTRLGLVEEDIVKNQLLSSKKAIEDHTGHNCIHFCYPDGNFNNRVAETTRACGYRSAVTTTPGRNRKGDDLMTLRRIPFPNSTNENEILAIISGCWPLQKFINDYIRNIFK